MIHRSQSVRQSVCPSVRPSHLQGVQWFRRLTGFHGAKATSAGARISHYHDGGRSHLAVPALANVGALGLFADGSQRQAAELGGEVLVALALGSPLLEPGRLEVEEGGGWRMEDGGWRMEGGGWRVEALVPTCCMLHSE